MQEDLFPSDPTRLSDLPLEFPDDPYGSQEFPDDPYGSQRSAARIRRSVLRGRDAPDESPTDLASLASVAASLHPVSNLLDPFGYMPDFRGGYEPSFAENLRQGNYLSGGLQLAGIFVPGVGTVRKIARATAGARRLARRGRIFDDSIRRAEGEVAQTDLPRQAPGVVSSELAGLFANEGLEAKMLAKIEEGKKAGALNWYNTEPVRQLFLKELGAQEGEQAFLRFMRYVAATSAASDVGPNVRNASHYFGRAAREGKLPDVGEMMESPYKHPMSRNHQIFVRKDFDDPTDQFTYQKLSSFFQNLIGNHAPVTVDRHALRLPAMLAEDKNFLEPAYREMLVSGKITMQQLVQIPAAWRAPKAAEYAALEQFYKGLARKAGLPPAQAQAAAWVGGAELTGVRDNGLLSFMQHFEDRVGLTAAKNKLTVDEVLRRFVRGQIDLSSLNDEHNSVA